MKKETVHKWERKTRTGRVFFLFSSMKRFLKVDSEPFWTSEHVLQVLIVCDIKL